MNTRLAVSAVAAGLVIVAGTVPLATADRGGRHVNDVREATAAYHSLDAAMDDGYTVEVADAAGLTCIEDPAGGMGVHYLNPELLNAEIDELRPELMVYAPEPDGDLRLGAVEYLVLADAWHEAQGKQPPQLFGKKFNLVPVGNRYGLPPFYALHLWLWESNPVGLLQDWNPDVDCP